MTRVDIEFADAQVQFWGRMEEIGVLEREAESVEDERPAVRLYVQRDGVIIDHNGSRDLRPGVYLLTSDGLFEQVRHATDAAA